MELLRGGVSSGAALLSAAPSCAAAAAVRLCVRVAMDEAGVMRFSVAVLTPSSKRLRVVADPCLSGVVLAADLVVGAATVDDVSSHCPTTDEPASPRASSPGGGGGGGGAGGGDSLADEYLPAAPRLSMMSEASSTTTPGGGEERSCAAAQRAGSPSPVPAMSAFSDAVVRAAAVEGLERGVGDAFFLLDADGRKVAVFKPQVAAAPAHQPKRGVDLAVAHVKERAAHLFDQQRSGALLAGVPYTEVQRVALDEHTGAAHILPPDAASAEAADSKRSSSSADAGRIGSLQQFVPHECSAEDVGSQLLSEAGVHRIAILDARLLNTDRHLANLLACRAAGGGGSSPSRGEQLVLAPIDHGLCLPSLWCLSDVYWGWSSWRQARVPFSAAERDLIAAIDVVADMRLLLDQGLRPEEVGSCAVGTVLLQSFAAAGGSPAAMARVAQAPFGPGAESEESDGVAAAPTSRLQELVFLAAADAGLVAGGEAPLLLLQPTFLESFLPALRRRLDAEAAVLCPR